MKTRPIITNIFCTLSKGTCVNLHIINLPLQQSFVRSRSQATVAFFLDGLCNFSCELLTLNVLFLFFKNYVRMCTLKVKKKKLNDESIKLRNHAVKKPA